MFFKTTLLSALLLFLSLSAFAQQEEQYTQFMQNKLAFNPAYAGAEPSTCFTLMTRNQWIGLDGAPQTQMLSANIPLLNQRIGIGVNLFRHSIGITSKYTGAFSYGYHLNLGRGVLGIGLQGSIRRLRVDFSEVQGTQPAEMDPAIPAGLQTKYVPNFGAGLFFTNGRFYAGLSIPRFLASSIDLADSKDVISREVKHVYMTSGLNVVLSEKLELQPNILIKYVAKAPFDGDINFNFVYDKKYVLGTSYRLGGSKRNGVGESLAFLLGSKFSEITVSLSYDITLTALKQFNSGTIELVAQYCLGGEVNEGTNVHGPRDFY